VAAGRGEMSFDLQRTLEEMVKAARKAAGRDSGKVTQAVREVLEDQRQALEAIARARLANTIDDDEMRQQLDDERLAFQAGLSMAKAMGKAAVQKAANAAFEALAKAIRQAAGIA